LFKPAVNPVGIEARNPQRAELALDQLPGRLAAEQTEEDDPQQHVLGAQLLGAVNHVADQVLRDTVGGAKGVAELVGREDRVVRPRRIFVAGALVEDPLPFGSKPPVRPVNLVAGNRRHRASIPQPPDGGPASRDRSVRNFRRICVFA